MSGTDQTGKETLENVLKMLSYLFGELSKGNKELANKCLTPEGRASLCEQFNVPTTGKGPGFFMVNYQSLEIESPLVPWILNTFEETKGGKPTSFTDIHPGKGPGTLLDTRLWEVLNVLLTTPNVWQQFINASEADRMEILSSRMRDSYGEETALSAYNQEAQNQSLGTSMKTIEQTLYNQYRFVC